MIDLSSIDSLVMSQTQGLDGFSAEYRADEFAGPVVCSIMRDTLELADEFGLPAIQSGAVLHCLKSEVGEPALGGWFIADGKKYTIENKIATQDSNWRTVHCRVELNGEVI